MTWLSWRQLRTPSVATLALLAVSGLYLVSLGMRVRDDQSSYLARCSGNDECAGMAAQFVATYENQFLLLAAGMYVVTVVLGMFLGAPLIAGELEEGTHKLAWNQSVTRQRWLTVKLFFACLLAATVAGGISLALTWAAAPLDAVDGTQFDAIVFGARHVVPVAASVAAVSLGATIGALSRRRLPAMAITTLATVALLVVMANVVRPNLVPSEHETRTMTADAINDARSLGSFTGSPTLGGLRVPDAWVTNTTPLLTSDGSIMPTEEFDRCFSEPPRTGASGTFGDTAACLADLELHVDLTYQPNSRYWPFQGLESLIYLCLALLFAALSGRLIRRSAG